MKENPTPLPRPPNQELLQHEKLRLIESKIYSYKKELIKEGISEDEIQEKVKQKR